MKYNESIRLFPEFRKALKEIMGSAKSKEERINKIIDLCKQTSEFSLDYDKNIFHYIAMCPNMEFEAGVIKEVIQSLIKEKLTNVEQEELEAILGKSHGDTKAELLNLHFCNEGDKGMYPLHAAVDCNNIAMVKAIIDLDLPKFEFNPLDDDNKTPLELAIEKEQPSAILLVQALKKKNILLDEIEKHSLLQLAFSSSSNEELLKLLVQEAKVKSELLTKDYVGCCNVLQLAIKSETCVTAVKVLLDELKGSNELKELLTKKNFYDHTALNTAIMELKDDDASVYIVAQMVVAGATIDAKAIWLALASKKYKLADHLINQAINNKQLDVLNTKNLLESDTILTYYIDNQLSKETINRLIDVGVDLTIPKNKLPLGVAAAKGNVEVMEALLKKDPNLLNKHDISAVTNNKDRAALHKAFENGQYGAIQYLLNQNDINVNFTEEENPLHFFACNCKVQDNEIEDAKKSIELLIKKSNDPSFINKSTSGGSTALHYCYNNLNAFKALIAHKPDYNLRTKLGETVLLISAQNCQKQQASAVALELLKLPNIDLTAQDGKKNNVLHISISNSANKIALAVIEKAAKDFLLLPNADNKSPIELAADKSNNDVVSALLAKKAYNKQTLVHVYRTAARRNNVTLLNALHEYKEISDADKEQALVDAAYENHQEAVSEILDQLSSISYIIDIKQKLTAGSKLLIFYAFENGPFNKEVTWNQQLIIKIIEKTKFDKQITQLVDPDGYDFLQTAINKGCLQVVKYLIEKKNFDINLGHNVKNYDRLPLRLCIRRGHIDILKYLLEHEKIIIPNDILTSAFQAYVDYQGNKNLDCIIVLLDKNKGLDLSAVASGTLCQKILQSLSARILTTKPQAEMLVKVFGVMTKDSILQLYKDIKLKELVDRVPNNEEIFKILKEKGLDLLPDKIYPFQEFFGNDNWKKLSSDEFDRALNAKLSKIPGDTKVAVQSFRKLLVDNMDDLIAVLSDPKLSKELATKIVKPLADKQASIKVKTDDLCNILKNMDPKNFKSTKNNKRAFVGLALLTGTSTIVTIATSIATIGKDTELMKNIMDSLSHNAKSKGMARILYSCIEFAQKNVINQAIILAAAVLITTALFFATKTQKKTVEDKSKANLEQVYNGFAQSTILSVQ